MKRMFVTIVFACIGGIVGFILPLVLLVVLGFIYAAIYRDPAAGGVLAFVMIGLGPIGALAGIALAVSYVNRWYAGGPSPSERWSQPDPGRRRFFARVLRQDDHGA
jgi:hypothetical protein